MDSCYNSLLFYIFAFCFFAPCGTVAGFGMKNKTGEQALDGGTWYEQSVIEERLCYL